MCRFIHNHTRAVLRWLLAIFRFLVPKQPSIRIKVDNVGWIWRESLVAITRPLVFDEFGGSIRFATLYVQIWRGESARRSHHESVSLVVWDLRLGYLRLEYRRSRS